MIRITIYLYRASSQCFLASSPCEESRLPSSAHTYRLFILLKSTSASDHRLQRHRVIRSREVRLCSTPTSQSTVFYPTVQLNSHRQTQKTIHLPSHLNHPASPFNSAPSAKKRDIRGSPPAWQYLCENFPRADCSPHAHAANSLRYQRCLNTGLRFSTNAAMPSF